nr:uncharacterized protein LOC129278312 [Lytechinus pictus]
MPCTVKKIQPRNFGSQLKIIASCEECDFTSSWYSQPKVGNLFAGNILLSAAVVLAGGSPTKIVKVFRHMNLMGISYATFMEHQGTYLQPAVVQVFNKHQEALFAHYRANGKGLTLGGDGRSDSPGHSAKYGSYTLMELSENKVLDVELVQVTEVANSNAMELEGLHRGLTKLKEADIPIENIVTDRHPQIAKYLRENHPDINHYYDVWHIAKGIKKKIKALGKMKDCELAKEWQRSLINHIYWAANSTQDGDGELIKAKYECSLNHIRNIHSGHGRKYPTCSHGTEHPDREWMKAGSKVYKKLSDIMLRPRLVNDVGKMSPFGQTSKVEAFHNVLLHWCPKLVSYSYQGMKCRLYVAVLHWNENGDRPQATDREGNPIYTIKYPRSKEGGYTVEKVLTPTTYGYVTTLMQEVLDLVANRRKISGELEELQPQPARCASFERPDKMEAIAAYEQHHRFAPAD